MNINYQLQLIADKIDSYPKNPELVGLMKGKMGAALFFYEYARYTGNTVYNERADNLLDEIFNQIGTIRKNDIEEGLSGIGWGINYLSSHGFVEITENALVDMESKIFSGNPVGFGTEISMLSPAIYLLSKLPNGGLLSNYNNQVKALLNTCRYYCLNIYDCKRKPLDLLNSMLYFLLQLKEEKMYPAETDKLIWKILIYLLDCARLEEEEHGDIVILSDLLNRIESSPLTEKVAEMTKFSFHINQKWTIDSYKKVLWQQILFSRNDFQMNIDINTDELLYLFTNTPNKQQGISLPLGLYLMNREYETL